MKKTICLSILVFLAICFAFGVANASDELISDSFTYQIKGNGTVIITSYNWNNNHGEDIYIPRLIDGHTVTEIGDLAFNPSYQMPLTYYGLSSINSHRNFAGHPSYMLTESNERSRKAFKDSLNIVGQEVVVILPDTITTIGQQAFMATEITAINIPQSVTQIGAGAFACCPNIKKFSVESGNEVYTTIDGVLYNKQIRELVAYPTGRIEKEGKLVIPNGIESIGDYAFWGIKFQRYTGNLHIVSLPSSLKKIGNYAFYGSSYDGLFDDVFTIPDSVTSIGDYAFAYAVLPNLSLPASLTTIGECAYKNATIYANYSNVSFPSGLSVIGAYAFKDFMFSHTSENTYDLTKTKITVIPQNAFDGLKCGSMILPNTITEIGPYAFSNTETSISVPSSVETIGAYAFANSKGAVDLSGDTSLRTIGDNAFDGFQFVGRDTFVLPSGLETMGNNVFSNTKALKYLKIPEAVISIGDNLCNRADIVLQVTPGSYAASWARENGYPTDSGEEDDLSWLGNHDDTPAADETEQPETQSEDMTKNINGWYISDDGKFAIKPSNLRKSSKGYIVSIQIREEATKTVLGSDDLSIETDSEISSLAQDKAIQEFVFEGNGKYSFKVVGNVTIGTLTGVTISAGFSFTIN